MSAAQRASGSKSSAKHECKEPGLLAPVIDRNRCEGKQDCLAECPCSVFEMGVLAEDERKKLSLVRRVKGFVHGYRQAFVVRPQDCLACGQCVTACPEGAITLARP
jgi:NAD-dependent dihydropyrimidine dehydrogenase PreA subunit